MAITNPAKRFVRRSDPWAVGPQITFAAAVLTAFAALAVAATTQPSDLVLPLVSTLFFVLAGLVTLVAWSRRRISAPDQVTYWDVAGALTFIGICAAAMVDPEQMLRLVEGTHREN